MKMRTEKNYKLNIGAKEEIFIPVLFHLVSQSVAVWREKKLIKKIRRFYRTGQSEKNCFTFAETKGGHKEAKLKFSQSLIFHQNEIYRQQNHGLADARSMLDLCFMSRERSENNSICMRDRCENEVSGGKSANKFPPLPFRHCGAKRLPDFKFFLYFIYFSYQRA